MLKTGEWVTRERVVFVSALVLGLSLVAGLALALTANGLVDRFGNPLGTDFASFWTAGALVNEGRALAPYDWPTHQAFQNGFFGLPVEADFYCWQYPPFFLAIAAALALLPYGGALMVWLGLTFAAYVGVMARLTGGIGLALLVAVAFPAVWINVGHGQNAFLTAALLAGALLALPTRPILAGVLIGLLAYKPHFGLLIPIALMFGGHWRTFAAAAVTVVLMVLATTVWLGFDVWQTFLASTDATRRVLLEAGGVGFHKIQSVFAAVRAAGGEVGLAYAVQGVGSLAVIAGTARLWASAADPDLKAAALLTGALLVSPFSLDYDLVLMAPAAAFLWRAMARTGALPYERSALAVLFLLPLFARTVASVVPVSLGLIGLVLLAALIARRAWPVLAGAGLRVRLAAR